MKKPTTPMILASLLSAAGVALTVTAYKKRHHEYSKDSNETDTLENKQEAAVAIAKVLEGDWQARIALAWKLIKENRTNEVNELICLKTLRPKEQKQHERTRAKPELKDSNDTLGNPYMLNSKESDQMECVEADNDPEEKAPAQYHSAVGPEWAGNHFQHTQKDIDSTEVNIGRSRK
jgi:hypothetical protein